MSRSIVLAWNHRVFRFHSTAVMAIWLAGIPAVSGISGELIQDTDY